MSEIFRAVFNKVTSFWREIDLFSSKRPRSTADDENSCDANPIKRLKLSNEIIIQDDGKHFTPQARPPLRSRRNILDENSVKMSRINERGSLYKRDEREAQSRELFESHYDWHGPIFTENAGSTSNSWKNSGTASLSPRSYHAMHQKGSSSRPFARQTTWDLDEKNRYNELLTSILHNSPLSQTISSVPTTQAPSLLVRNVAKLNELSFCPWIKGTLSKKHGQSVARRSDLSLLPCTVDLTNEEDSLEEIYIDYEKVKSRTPRYNQFEAIIKEERWTDPVFCEARVKSWQEDLKRKSKQIERMEDGKKVLQEVNGKSLDQYVRERLKKVLIIKEAIIEEPEIEEAPKMPVLTPEMEEKVEKAWACRNPGQVLSEGFGLRITQRDLITLARLNWLNDEVINFYMNLLMDRNKLGRYPKVYAFNTFFYPKLVTGGHASLKRWTKKVDIFEHDLVVVPVHLGAHWCLSVINFQKRSIDYYDSMGHPNQKCLSCLFQYLKDESMDKKKVVFDHKDWTLNCIKNNPLQMNGSDCGMFACMFAEYITRGASITFSQDNMPYFRKKMAYEILTKQLLEFK